MVKMVWRNNAEDTLCWSELQHLLTDHNVHKFIYHVLTDHRRETITIKKGCCRKRFSFQGCWKSVQHILVSRISLQHQHLFEGCLSLAGVNEIDVHQIVLGLCFLCQHQSSSSSSTILLLGLWPKEGGGSMAPGKEPENEKKAGNAAGWQMNTTWTSWHWR